MAFFGLNTLLFQVLVDGLDGSDIHKPTAVETKFWLVFRRL